MLSVAEPTDQLGTRRFVEHVMGLPISLALRGRHAGTDRGRAAWDGVMAELVGVDRVFSTYRPDSFVSRLGRGEICLADCPEDVRTVLELGDQAARSSGGAFSTLLPSDPSDPGSPRRLDPSGVVKGWATERAARRLQALEDTDFCLSAGGDLTCRASPEREPWRIGIENPDDPSRIIAVVPLRVGAVATSGAARRGAHLVDARTGRLPSGIAQVSVIGPSLTWADIDATAAYARGADAAHWLTTRPVFSAVVVRPDGAVLRVLPSTPDRPLPNRGFRHESAPSR